MRLTRFPKRGKLCLFKGNKWRKVVMKVSTDDETQEVSASGQVPSSQNHQADKHEAYGFYGAFNHSIDVKGRLIVPQPFRDRLGEKIIVGVNMAQSSIAIYPVDVWQRKVDMLTQLAQLDVSAEVFLERFSMLSFDSVSFDMQGRILLPAALREMYMKDASGVQVSGAREYVRVISSQQASEEQSKFAREHADVLADISRIQARTRT